MSSESEKPPEGVRHVDVYRAVRELERWLGPIAANTPPEGFRAPYYRLRPAVGEGGDVLIAIIRYPRNGEPIVERVADTQPHRDSDSEEAI